MPPPSPWSNGPRSTTTTPWARYWRVPCRERCGSPRPPPPPGGAGRGPPAGVGPPPRAEPRRAPRQRALLELLARQPGASAAFLDEHARPWREAARALAARGFVARTETAVART